MMGLEEKKNQKIELIEKFYGLYGRLPKQTEKMEQIAIGRFLSNVSCGDTKLTIEQIARLEKLGFASNIREKKKEIKIELIEKFYDEYHRLPTTSEKMENVSIGQFLIDVKHRKVILSEEHMTRLKVLGFTMVLKNREEEKEKRIQLIEQFYNENGSLPKQKEFSNGIAIGTFLNSVQQERTRLTDEQMNRLTKLGFENPQFSKKRQLLLKQLREAKEILVASEVEKSFVKSR